MSAVSLTWRSVPYEKDRFFVVGTILAQAIVPGTLSRFAIREVRGRADVNGDPVLRYALADADTVSDADVRAGKLPKVIFTGAEPDDCIRFLEREKLFLPKEDTAHQPKESAM